MEVLYNKFEGIKKTFGLNLPIIRIPINDGKLIAEIYPPTGFNIPLGLRKMTGVHLSGEDYLKEYAGKNFDKLELEAFKDKVTNRLYFFGVTEFDDDDDSIVITVNEWENLREEQGFALHVCCNVIQGSITGYSNGKNAFIHVDAVREWWADDATPFQFTLAYTNDEAFDDDFVKVHLRKDILKVVLSNLKFWEKYLT